MLISQKSFLGYRIDMYLINLISTGKYKARDFVLIVCLACAFIFMPLVSDAAITVTTGTGNLTWPSQPIAQFVARFGNDAITAPWELSNNWNNGTAQDTQQYVWLNGVNVPFTFNHNSVTGTTTLTLAGVTTTTWNFTPPFLTQDIWLRVYTFSSNYTSRIDNLSLNGTPIGASIVAQGSPAYTYMHIHRDQIPYSQLANFNLTGNINFSWTGSPSTPQIQAMFTMQEYYPPPTGVNTRIMLFIALLAISTGLLILKRHRLIT
jgi:hypothetical protein